MEMKKCVTYFDNKPKELVNTKIKEYCHKLLISDNISNNEIKRLCRMLCYSSLFIIPEYELENNKMYTFENVCYHVTGLLKLPMHDFLENISEIAMSKQINTDCLKDVLHDHMFPEIMSLLHHNSKEIYSVLMYIYFYLIDDKDNKEFTRKAWKDPTTPIYNLLLHFEKEVIGNDIGLL